MPARPFAFALTGMPSMSGLAVPSWQLKVEQLSKFFQLAFSIIFLHFANMKTFYIFIQNYKNKTYLLNIKLILFQR